MPFEITNQGDFLLLRIFGVTTPADLNQLVNEVEILEDALPTSLNQLTDITAVERFEVGFLDINALAARRRARAFSRAIKCAIVVKDPLQFGLARMYETLNENPRVEIRIVHSAAEAKAWFAEIKNS